MCRSHGGAVEGELPGLSPSVALVISAILLSAGPGTRKGLPWRQGDFTASPHRPKSWASAALSVSGENGSRRWETPKAKELLTSSL